MTIRPRTVVLMCGLIPTCLAAVSAIYRPPLFANLERRVYDILVRSVPTRPTDSRIVIVDVDERSLAAIGQWPWPRDRVAGLISRLRELGASTVALDVMFAEPDRHDGPGGRADAALAGVLRSGAVVLGYAFTFESGTNASGACVQHPLGLAIVRRGRETADDPFFRPTGAICSLPILTQAASASGFLNALPDPDGIIRRAPLIVEFDGRVYPSFPLAAVLTLAPPRDIALRVVNVNASALMIDSHSVPLDGRSNLLVRYRGRKRTFRYVSAADVMSDRARSDDFSRKLVFVGTTAIGTREVVTTPLDTQFAAVEAQATVADNLLRQDFFHQHEYGITLEAQAVLILGILAALLVGQFGLGWGAFGVGAMVAAAWGWSTFVLSRNGLFLSPLYPTLGVAAAYAAMIAAQLTIEHRRADTAVRGKATSQQLMIQSLLSLTQVRDAETGRHSRRTQGYSRLLAEALASHPRFTSYLTPQTIDLLSRLAPLHDIGKVGVPDRLLNKPGSLTADELEEMRRHPTHGRDVILHAEQEVGESDDGILALAKDIVYTHHEKWDGTGYPQGLRGNSIPIAGRLIAVVDVYDAVVTRRIYRQPMSHDEAVAFIKTGKGSHFDPDVVDAFVKVADRFWHLSNDAD
jgi:HD-GYP domain-containing protein (c-di-GMP phosphodiesterase class II)